MALLDFLLGSNQQPPMGGVAGQLMQAQPQGIVAQQQPLMQQRPKFWQTPEFAGTLSRLGANLAAASTQNEGFLDSLSLAAAQTVKDNEAARAQGMQNQLLQAQINKANAEAQPASPFSGTGFENQVAGTYYNAYLQQGLSPMEAQIKAAQAVFNREPTYITNAEGQLIPIPGRTLPTIGTATAPTPATAPAAAPASQPDAIDQTAASLGLPAGTLLPPPSGTQPQGAMPTQGVLPAPSFMAGGQIAVPQVAGPKTQQALAEEAGKANIAIQKEAAMGTAKSQQEKQSEFRTQAAQLPMLMDVVGKLNTLADQASFTLPQQAGDFVYRQLGLPTQGDTARAEYIATVRNVVLPLLKSTFGAAFTAKEGESLLETLGSPDATPAAKKATLNSFIEQKIRNLQASAKDAGIELPSDLLNTTSGIVRVQTKEQLDVLPKGTRFIAPDGTERVKP